MGAQSPQVEYVLLVERPVLPGLKQGQDSEKLLLADAGVLQAVKDVKGFVTVQVERSREALLLGNQVALLDQLGFPGVDEPEQLIFLRRLQIGILRGAKFVRIAEGIGKARPLRGVVPQQDAGIAEGQQQFQPGQKLGFQVFFTGGIFPS